MDYPTNSDKSKAPRPKVERVVKTQVVRREKSLTQKFLSTFTSEDVHSVSSNVIRYVVIPAVQNLFYDVIVEAASRTFFGEARSNRGRSSSWRTPQATNYSRYYSNPSDTRRSVPSRDVGHRTDNFRDYIIPDKAEAEMVLDHMVDLTQEYGSATVGDLYDLLGVTSDYPNNNWGWQRLSDARTSRVQGGYVLVLPEPRVLDR